MKALSVKQPWAWLLAYGRKTIEVRVWGPKSVGLVPVGEWIAIHASVTLDPMDGTLGNPSTRTDPQRETYCRGSAAGIDYDGVVHLRNHVALDPMKMSDLFIGHPVGIALVEGVTLYESADHFNRDSIQHCNPYWYPPDFDAATARGRKRLVGIRFSVARPWTGPRIPGALGFWELPIDVIAPVDKDGNSTELNHC
jgi:hypothetical protein